MVANRRTASLDARLDALEREVRSWRRLALGGLALAALGASLAFQQPRVSPVPLEASALTLRNDSGSSVVLSVRASGDLEARFIRGISLAAPDPGSASLILVNPLGQTVARLGELSVRPLGR